MDKRGLLLTEYLAILMLILLVSLVFFFAGKEKIEDITGKATWNISTQEAFNLGTYVNTTSNSSGAIFLNQTVFLDDLNSSGYMIAWWHFDNDTNDYSGRGNNLANSNAVSNITNAKFGTSYHFNGVWVAQMSTTNTSSLRLADNFTIATWVYDSSTAKSVIMAKGLIYMISSTDSAPCQASGNWNFCVNMNRSTSNYKTATDPDAHPQNTWQLLVGRKNASHISLFVDGVQKAVTAASGVVDAYDSIQGLMLE